jgi:hypothetical protein
LRYGDVTDQNSSDQLAACACQYEDDFFEKAVEFGGDALGDWKGWSAVIFDWVGVPDARSLFVVKQKKP